MIVLVFQSPDGRVGFTEADSIEEAVSMVKVYKTKGYRLMEHHVMKEGDTNGGAGMDHAAPGSG